MPTIAEIRRRAESLQLEQQIPVLINETKFEIIRFNQYQLSSGFLSTGEKITPKYQNITYAIGKEKTNPLPGFLTPDLKLTGDWYRGMGVVVNGGVIEYTNSDSKDQKLRAKYGEDIRGLTTESKGKYNSETLRPKIMGYIRSKGLPVR